MNPRILFFLLLSGVLFTSCISTKDMTYLQSKDGAATNGPITPILAKPYRLQTNDILSIEIKAIDPKLVAMFNPNASGEKIGQSEQGLYFEGFVIDDHGNIRIPILGELNVLGYTVNEVRLKSKRNY